MTSYVKMIDIWMLFTMTVPFLEVALHTCTEVMKRQGMPKFLATGQVHQVKPEDQLDLEVPRVVPAWVGVVGRLMVSITSILFTAICPPFSLSVAIHTMPVLPSPILIKFSR